MADIACRSCGATVPAGATTCPHCGAADPVVASAATGPRPELATPTPHSEPHAPVPERRTGPGERLRSAAKAIGCLVLALILLGIALVVGVFDLLF